MLIVTCQCGQKMKVPPKLVGKSCKCVKCGLKLEITEDGAKPLPDQVPVGDQQPTPEDKPREKAPPDSLEQTRIGQLLIQDGLIGEEQLKEALEVQLERGGRTFEILLSLGHIDKKSLHDFLSRQSGVPSIDVKNYHIPRELLSLTPEKFARDHLVLPIDKLGKLLTVAMACPLDRKTIAEIEQISGLRVKPMLSKLDDIIATIDKCYPKDKEPGYGISKPAAKPAAKPAPKPGAEAAAKAAAEPKKEKAPAKPALTPEEVRSTLAQLDALPTFLETVQRVRKTVENPKSSLRDVADIICTDPSLVARLLSVTNAAVYGMPGQVNDIHLASALLGIDGICEIVVSARIGGAVHDSAHFDLTAFSASSQFCATAAYGVAAVCNPSLNPCARTAGFLHEIGRLALAENWPEHYPATNGQLTGQALIEAEEKTFGIAHPEAGYIIAREWGLPAEITETLRFHHAPQSASEDKQLVAIVALAAYMAEIQQGRGTEKGDPFDACKELLDALGLGKAAVAQIFSETATAVTARST